MSYRDVRNFTEMMRALGYPRLISMENFRTPNFTLVAEILQWLVLRYDPNTDIPMDIEHENDRVLFIKSVAQFMMIKAHIKLNTKRLYGADGMAVKELLKVTSVLYEASRKVHEDEAAGEGSIKYIPIEFNSKINGLKQARQLASEITVKGSTLHQLLGREVELRHIRQSCIARPMDLNEIEKNVEKMMNETRVSIDKTKNQLESIASDEANLEAKIEKRKAELERNEKRLRSLESVRPAFMDEYETLEKELESLYKVYIEKYRNLVYLEQMTDEMKKSEQDKLNDSENPLKIAMKAKEEHDNLIRGSLGFAASESDDDAKVTEEKAPKAAPKKKVIGSMGGGLESDDEDSEGLSSGSEAGEAGDDLLDNEEDEENDDGDDDDGDMKDNMNDSDDNF